MSRERITLSPPLNAAAVRQGFLDFFAEREHRVVPSAPVFPQDDPTLLFTNAGMNQFKDVFLGTGSRDYARAVDTQKCIRVSGKHNDLEEVGLDTFHHTFFEMLGNWSFGDYFKEEAIVWAWELLTEVWKMPRERLWVTVFGGDEKDGLPPDEEAERIWRERTGIDPARVLRCGRKDNFWEMGETGPCGPCSEIHIDRGDEGTDPSDGADPAIGVNAGNERFIELWNLVFMQFNRLDDGSLRELPARHVDTGMGLERVVAVLQGAHSNYDTDLFTPIFARLGEICGHAYGSGPERIDVAFRVCADHVRAVCSALADGALPSNTGRGYVLRRLIRRAARFGRQDLGLEEPFLFALAPPVCEILGDAFPEMRQRQDHVALILREEEEAFGRTLGRGLVRFEELAGRVGGAGAGELPGAKAFELYATYGFPRDLVELMARERGLAVDEPGWTTAEKEHQAKSRSEGKFRQLLSAEELGGLPATESTYHEEGPRSEVLETELLLVRREESGQGEPENGFALVLRESPFYPEAGGQAGDRGRIEAVDGSFAVDVCDTQRVGPVVVHRCVASGGAGPDPATAPGSRVRAAVDAPLRDRTRKNHTATHLLHRALRDVLGEHVVQQGSYVGPDRLRFDFSHPKQVAREELDAIEALVNEKVAWNPAVTTTEEDLEEAKARGVVAMFGEKYDQVVRVLDVGGWSTELCGGTHVSAAGDIGPFLIHSERAVAAGVRRIEALTGPAAVEEIQRQRRVLQDAARSLKTGPDELVGRIEDLQRKLREQKKQKSAAAKGDLDAALARIAESREEAGGVAWAVVDLPELDAKGLRELADRAKGQVADQALALFGRDGDKVPFVVVVAGNALERGLAAGAVAQALRPVLGGGGGGRPDRAQGQGTRAEGLPEALGIARESLLAALTG